MRRRLYRPSFSAILLSFVLGAGTPAAERLRFDFSPDPLAKFRSELERQLQCPEPVAVPAIDGKLDDPGWRTCAQFMPFVEAEGRGLAQVQTKALVFHSDAGLHVAFVCDEPKMPRLHVCT